MLASTADSLLTIAARRSPSASALGYGRATLTYGDVERQVGRLARRLGDLAAASGVALEGARVAVIASNTPAFVIALLATWRCGAVVVPIGARLKEHDLTEVLRDAAPAVVVGADSAAGPPVPDAPGSPAYLALDDVGRPVLEQRARSPVGPGDRLDADVAGVLYTSGTDGKPKGALLTHASALAWGHGMAERLELAAREPTVLVVPAAHAFGFGCLLAALASGAFVALVDSTVAVRPTLDAMLRHRATVLHGSPTLFARVLGAGAPRGARKGFVAGAPCPRDVLERADAMGLTLLNLFGMTETGGVTSCRLEDGPAVRHATAGRPLPGYEVRIVPAGVDEPGVGHLQVRGAFVTPGYFRRPRLTAESFDGEWFRTGDLARSDRAGNISIVGRVKDVVHVAGFTVSPVEVERVLAEHDDVAEAAVVGVPDGRTGEGLRAYVVARAGADPPRAALLRHVRARLAGYKVPYDIRLVDSLPTLASGKLDRAALSGGRPARAGRRHTHPNGPRA